MSIHITHLVHIGIHLFPLILIHAILHQPKEISYHVNSLLDLMPQKLLPHINLSLIGVQRKSNNLLAFIIAD